MAGGCALWFMRCRERGSQTYYLYVVAQQDEIVDCCWLVLLLVPASQ
jgi:hypothetical protein